MLLHSTQAHSYQTQTNPTHQPQRAEELDQQGFQTYFTICGINDLLASHPAKKRFDVKAFPGPFEHFQSKTRCVEVVSDTGLLKRLRFRTPTIWEKLDQAALRPKIEKLVFDTCTIDEQVDGGWSWG